MYRLVFILQSMFFMNQLFYDLAPPEFFFFHFMASHLTDVKKNSVKKCLGQNTSGGIIISGTTNTFEPSGTTNTFEPTGLYKFQYRKFHPLINNETIGLINI